MCPQYRIMLVDDDDDIRMVLSVMLGLEYEVVSARDGVEALEKLEACEPDIFVLDVNMPVMNGFDTCEAIRRLPRYHCSLVIFLSGIDAKEEIRKLYEIGGNFFIQKPFTADRILKNLSLSLEKAPPPAPKRFTLDQIKRMEQTGELLMVADEAPAPSAPPAPPAPQAARAQTPAPQARPVMAAPPPSMPQPGQRPAASPAFAAKLAPAGVNRETVLDGRQLLPRLMIVDDDEDIQFILSTAFNTRFEIITANDGRDAISKMMDVEPDLLLLDISMPRMNGFDLCQSLRRTKRFSQLPIIFLSANSDARNVKQAKQVGGTDFIAKPCSVGEVEKVLNNVMASKDFRIKAKRKKIEQLLDPVQLYEDKRRKLIAKQSVDKDFGGLRKFIEENFMKDLKS
ncbi:MAG: response regulator [Candidatus Sumerlaeota bacterium]|nr:response regulator [Candidatus Sumerlaeota bacterium]